jgi:hypothetical protein
MGDNCVEIYKYGVAYMLAWRLLHSGTSLPDATVLSLGVKLHFKLGGRS